MSCLHTQLFGLKVHDQAVASFFAWRFAGICTLEGCGGVDGDPADKPVVLGSSAWVPSAFVGCWPPVRFAAGSGFGPVSCCSALPLSLGTRQNDSLRGPDLQGPWMNGEDALESLAKELAALRLENSGLRERVRDLEGDKAGSECSFLLVEEEASGSAGGFPSGSGAVPSREERLQVAREIGGFFKRALAGDHRRSSGRDKVPLPSVIYVVLRNFEGQAFTTPQIFTEFRAVSRLCKRGSGCGESVFAGFPSKWEAEAAILAAGFPSPFTSA